MEKLFEGIFFQAQFVPVFVVPKSNANRRKFVRSEKYGRDQAAWHFFPCKSIIRSLLSVVYRNYRPAICFHIFFVLLLDTEHHKLFLSLHYITNISLDTPFEFPNRWLFPFHRNILRYSRAASTSRSVTSPKTVQFCSFSVWKLELKAEFVGREKSFTLFYFETQNRTSLKKISSFARRWKN